MALEILRSHALCDNGLARASASWTRGRRVAWARMFLCLFERHDFEMAMTMMSWDHGCHEVDCMKWVVEQLGDLLEGTRGL